MTWYVCKEIDSAEEIQERRKFYSELTGCTLSFDDSDDRWFLMNDGRKDNRCMIIGHTNTVYEIMVLLRSKRIKYFICSCAMSLKEFKEITSRISSTNSVFLASQDMGKVGDVSVRYRDGVSMCEFIDKTKTGFGFKITRSELGMYHSNFKGFHNKLESCFSQIKEH